MNQRNGLVYNLVSTKCSKTHYYFLLLSWNIYKHFWMKCPVSESKSTRFGLFCWLLYVLLQFKKMLCPVELLHYIVWLCLVWFVMAWFVSVCFSIAVSLQSGWDYRHVLTVAPPSTSMTLSHLITCCFHWIQSSATCLWGYYFNMIFLTVTLVYKLLFTEWERAQIRDHHSPCCWSLTSLFCNVYKTVMFLLYLAFHMYVGFLLV